LANSVSAANDWPARIIPYDADRYAELTLDQIIPGSVRRDTDFTRRLHLAGGWASDLSRMLARLADIDHTEHVELHPSAAS
jgi:hypothetical protein